MNLYFSISGLLNAFTIGILGLFVFLKTKTKAARVFFLMCLAGFVWSCAYIFWPLAENKEDALFWFQVLHIGSIFVSVFYLNFVTLFLDLYKKFKKLIILGYVLAFFFSSSVFSPWFIKDMVPKFSMKYWANPGILYHFYLIMFFGYMIFASYLLVAHYKKTTGAKRGQIKYILLGTIIAYIGGSTNYPLWYDINFPPYGNILASAYVIFIAYAIVQHRLMDIRIVVRQITVYGVSLIISIGLSVLLMLLALNYLSFYISSPFIGSVILVFGIIVFQLVKERFGKFANHHLFYTLYSYEKTLSALTEKLSKSIDLNRLVFLSTETIKDVMKLDKIALILRKLEPPKGQLKLLENHYDKKDILKDKEGEDDFYLAKNLAFDEEKINSLIKNLFLIHYLESGKSLIVKDELEHLAEEVNDERLKNKFLTLADFMEKTETTLYLPLIIEDRLIGLFVLGKKVSGDAYTVQDIGLLETVASQVSIAINNAQLYEQSQYFNQILRIRVVEATKELAGAYRELKKLDDSKTEFLSLASHQLRTPLSAIKGYLSMVLEGSFGKLQKETEEALRNVYESNERLIVLVNDLLNITRIEAGKLEYKPIKTDLDKLINSVVNELKITAEKKRLDMKYTDKNLPYVLIDPGKIRQVLINLIDNAIKYTPHGEVVIKTSVRNKKEIVIEVRDTGIGISKDKMEHLFEWLSRGKGALRLDAGGFGLGLYIAKKIIERAGGKVWAESPGENKGSTFAFSLPIK